MTEHESELITKGHESTVSQYHWWKTNVSRAYQGLEYLSWISSSDCYCMISYFRFQFEFPPLKSVISTFYPSLREVSHHIKIKSWSNGNPPVYRSKCDVSVGVCFESVWMTQQLKWRFHFYLSHIPVLVREHDILSIPSKKRKNYTVF